MKPYALRIAPGKKEVVSVPGAFIYLDSIESLEPGETIEAVTIRAQRTGDQAIMKPGWSARFSPFNRIELSHDSLFDALVVVYVGLNTYIETPNVVGNLTLNGGQVQPVGGAENAASPPLVDLLYPRQLSEEFGENRSVIGTVTLLNPAQNVSGVKITNAFVQSRSLNMVTCGFIAALSEPDATLLDNAGFYNNKIIVAIHQPAGCSVPMRAEVGPIELKPGYGLYYQQLHAQPVMLYIDYWAN